MDYKQLTSPCGRDCFNCPLFHAQHSPGLQKQLAKRFGIPEESASCTGCRNIKGECKLLHAMGADGTCRIFSCTKEKNVTFCFECNNFPCEKLEPRADKATVLPHNLKVYNLCKIEKIGLKKWADEVAGKSFSRYLEQPLEF